MQSITQGNKINIFHCCKSCFNCSCLILGADSKSVHIFITETEVSELYIHSAVYGYEHYIFIALYSEFENSWNYIEQDLRQGFNLYVIN